jgi:hypothetical protein
MLGTGQRVIIKKLRPAADPSIKRAFLRELRIVTKAIHHRVLRALFHRDDPIETYYIINARSLRGSQRFPHSNSKLPIC